MTEEVETSEFANSLQQAMNDAMGRKDEESPSDTVVTEEVEEEKEEVVEEATEEVKEEEPQEQEEEFKLIPKEWTASEKKKFEDALENPDTKEAAEAFIERYENLRKDYHKKAGERAEYAKKVSIWDDVFDTRAKEALRQRGIDEPTYVRRLLNVEQSLITNPADTIKKLMEAYKVDPSLITGNTNDDDSIVDYDKTIAEMRKEIADLKNNKTQSETKSAASEDAYIAKQIKDFEFAIDDSGEPKYPLFKEVKDEMGILLQKGKAKTLEEAYNMTPTVRELALEEKQKAQSRQDMEADKKAVAQAKKAARGVTNKKVATQPPRKMSFEDRFKEKLREHKASS